MATAVAATMAIEIVKRLITLNTRDLTGIGNMDFFDHVKVSLRLWLIRLMGAPSKTVPIQPTVRFQFCWRPYRPVPGAPAQG